MGDLKKLAARWAVTHFYMVFFLVVLIQPALGTPLNHSNGQGRAPQEAPPGQVMASYQRGMQLLRVPEAIQKEGLEYQRDFLTQALVVISKTDRWGTK